LSFMGFVNLLKQKPLNNKNRERSERLALFAILNYIILGCLSPLWQVTQEIAFTAPSFPWWLKYFLLILAVIRIMLRATSLW